MGLIVAFSSMIWILVAVVLLFLCNQEKVTKPIMVECKMADEGGGAPLTPPNLVQAIAAILTGRNEQTALLRRLVEQGAAPRPGHHHPPPVPRYQEFLGTPPSLFHKADELLEAES